VFQAIRDSFPPPILIPRRPHISLTTLQSAAETRSLKQQIRYLRTFIQLGNFSNVSKPEVLQAITDLSAYLTLLCKKVGRQSRHDLSKYIVSVASELEGSLFKNQPELAWKILKRLIGTAPGNKYSPDRSLPYYMTVSKSLFPLRLAGLRPFLNTFPS
jgi:hypothetical protein